MKFLNTWRDFQVNDEFAFFQRQTFLNKSFIHEKDFFSILIIFFKNDNLENIFVQFLASKS